jgi:ferrous iron transport protein B
MTLVNEFGIGTLMALLVWFVFAPQCISTFAVMRRETNSYLWPSVMVTYTLILAYGMAFCARYISSFLF